MNAPFWRRINIALCLAGVLVFGGMFIYLQSMPADFEHRAQGFVIDRIDAELARDSRIAKLTHLSEGATLPSDRIAAPREELRASFQGFIKLVVEAMCPQACENRDAIEDALVQAYDRIELKLKPRFEVLRDMVEAKYHAVFDELRIDIEIFLGANLIVLATALVLALIRGRAARHLAPIALLMTVATLLTSNWYVFGQSWVLTFIYSDYFGWSYLAFLSAVFLLLADIALNGGRLVTNVLNAVADLLRLPFDWAPC